MQLQYPAPIRSKYDPQTAEPDIDYSMSNPLQADGSNYPCKNYNTPEAYAALDPVATLTAGSPFKVQFAAGGATHLGGSCQFSVSYDQGKTFAVIYSVVGGCPLSYAYSVPIPASLPSSPKATFAWTWVSRATREMYGNCAIVAIKGDGSAKSFTGPGLFRANTLSDGTCISPNNADVVYPNPGPALEYGGSITSSSPPTPLEPCSYNQVTTVTISPDESSSSTPKPSASSSSTPKPSTSSQADPSTTSSARRVRVCWGANGDVEGDNRSANEDVDRDCRRLDKDIDREGILDVDVVVTQRALVGATISDELERKAILRQQRQLQRLPQVPLGLLFRANNTIIMAPAAKIKRMDRMVRRAGPAYLHTRPLTH
ncbi:hypothetical protein B0A53_02015 [Rhodotorula sp. CCFEE 5036]|nr:hypothetical protein B0A53_02015 [Rhodotorula sp. CCFEE 5036]